MLIKTISTNLPPSLCVAATLHRHAQFNDFAIGKIAQFNNFLFIFFFLTAVSCLTIFSPLPSRLICEPSWRLRYRYIGEMTAEIQIRATRSSLAFACVATTSWKSVAKVVYEFPKPPGESSRNEYKVSDDDFAFNRCGAASVSGRHMQHFLLIVIFQPDFPCQATCGNYAFMANAFV